MSLRAQALVAEIGSTVTSVSAFTGLDGPAPVFLGQGCAPTSVSEGDVRMGLEAALASLELKLGGQLSWESFLAVSSAAGGLRMSVHGVMKDMTVRAAREAALGAGANLHLVTAGKLRETDVMELKRIAPNIVLLAGGVDYGERETVLHNGALLARANLTCPVIYAGNIQVKEEIRGFFETSGTRFYAVENVYPAIDRLEVGGARRVIQEVFEEHITEAPGMGGIREKVDGTLIPTPGAVIEAAQLLREAEGDLAVIDVGGATTDVHAVCEDSQEFGPMLLAPEPLAKRTVEGDLGTFISRKQVLKAVEPRLLAKSLGLSQEQLRDSVEALPPLPRTDAEGRLAGALAEEAARLALERHAGRVRYLYGPRGKTRVAEGKDLTGLRLLIATGGGLTRLPDREGRLRRILNGQRADVLTPAGDLPLAFDDDYIMAAAGVLSRRWPEGALTLLRRSLSRTDKDSVPRKPGVSP